MTEINVFIFSVLVTKSLTAYISDNSGVSNRTAINVLQLEQEFIGNLSQKMNEGEVRRKQTKKKNNDLKKPQIPPVNGDPIEAVQSRIPCECKTGICSCCLGGFFFDNKGCMKLKYIPEDFAFEIRMTFNDNVLYKNTMSGKNPRPICISPPRFDRWLEMCAKFHDIYFVGRNMHLCLDISATLGDFDLIDRQFDCMKFGTDGVALVAEEDGGGHPGYPPVINAGTDAEIDVGGTDDIEAYDEVVG